MRIIERESFRHVAGGAGAPSGPIQMPNSTTINGTTSTSVFSLSGGGTLAVVCTSISAGFSIGIQAGKVVPVTGSLSGQNSTCTAITYDAQGHVLSTVKVSAADLDNGDVTVASNGTTTDTGDDGGGDDGDDGDGGDGGDGGGDGGDGGGDGGGGGDHDPIPRDAE